MRIKNWKKFQHFKDRRPPWIKLHRDILEQRDINMISDRSFRVLVCIWLLASEDEEMGGTLPPISDIAFRLRIDESEIIKALQELSPFLVQDDIKPISERYQVDDPETETERETEIKRADQIDEDDLPFIKPSASNDLKSKAYIKTASKILYEQRDFKKINALVNTYRKKKINNKTIAHVLKRCIDSNKKGDLWGYCKTIIDVEDQNFNEADFMAEQEAKDKDRPETFKEIFKEGMA